MVEDVNLGKGKRLIMSSASEEKLIIAAIASVDDNRDLVKVILDQILQFFIDKFSQNLREVDSVAISTHIDELLKKKVINKTFKRILKSWVVQFFLGIFFGIIGLAIKAIGMEMMPGNAQGQYVFLFVLGTIFVLIMFPFPMFVSGYIIADRKKGHLNIFLYLLLVAIGFSFDNEIIIVLAGNFIMILVLSVLFLYMGIIYNGKKKLRPL
jgi:hypothetical protein